MITKRKFFSMAIIMAVIFFLFQFTGVAKDIWNDYGTNEYAAEAEELPKESDSFLPLSYSEVENGEEPFAVYIGPDEDSMWEIMKEWAMYAKMSMFCYESIADYDNVLNPSALPEMIIVDGENIYSENDVDRIIQYTMLGINVVYSNLPEYYHIMNNDKLRRLLGIKYLTAGSTEVCGYHLFQGLILGGEIRYMALDEESEKRQDMELELPWYMLGGGTKVYMKGIIEDETVKAEEYPPAIWRHSVNNAYVFAVNGNFMQDITAIGLLQGMRAETVTNMIYPVVNAESLIINNYPALSDENKGKMDELFSLTMPAVCKEVIWPSVSAVKLQNNLGVTCMFSPQRDYNDDAEPKEDDVQYYLKLFKEAKVEAGLSYVHSDDTDISGKLDKDKELFDKTVSGYSFSSFYAGDMSDSEIKTALGEEFLKDVQTVVTDYDSAKGILGYVDANVTRQAVLAEAYSHTYSENLRMRSIQSALGYSNVSAGMDRVLYPKEGEETWEELSKKYSGNLYTFWRPFKAFDAATVSESDARIRNFLSMNYSYEDYGDTIKISAEAENMPVWFIFRTNNKVIDDIEGGDYTLIEKEAYLIRADEKTVTIKLESESKRYYYE